MARTPSDHVRQRPTPRISANDLARYMVAGETGKLGIIKRAKEAKTSTVVRYAKVREDIATYLCDLGRSQTKLAALQNKYGAMAEDAGLGNWAREDARLSVEVLNALQRMENQIGGSRFAQAPKRQVPLVVNGVEVSIYLNVLMVRERAGTDEVGGVLFRMTKADDESDTAASKRREMGAYAATLALMQTEARHGAHGRPHHQLCASLDIQCEDVHLAPRSYANKARDIEAACRFIAAVWDDV